MVKRVVRESEGPIGERRRQLGCLRGQLEDLGASQRVWEASIVFRSKLVFSASYNLPVISEISSISRFSQYTKCGYTRADF